MLDPTLPPLFAATLADPQHVLETVFGYGEVRPGQRQVLRGRDRIGVMPTGVGKSITFQDYAWFVGFLAAGRSSPRAADVCLVGGPGARPPGAPRHRTRAGRTGWGRR